MKCSDIPDDLFLEVVKYTEPNFLKPLPSGIGWDAYRGRGKGWTPGNLAPDGTDPWRSRWDVQRNLAFVMGCEIPEKLFLAKARKLGKQGRLLGCTNCSCRGDYHLPSECPHGHC